MRERINFVDKNDQVLGQDYIDIVKEKKFNYRIAHIWIFDQNEKLMVCKRPLNTKSYPGVWTSSAGGHVTAGENYQQAAEREAEEELGISSDLEHAFIIDFHNPNGYHLFIDLWFTYPKNLAEVNVDQREIAVTRFISLPDLFKEMRENPKLFNPEFIQLVERWIKEK